MKILFVTINDEHANDSELNLRRGLMEVSQVDFFGPGFSTTDELESGLKNYWNKGKYDALILSFAFAIRQITYLDLRYIFWEHRYKMSDYSIYESIRYADRIIEESKEISSPKLVHYHFDTISFTEFQERCLQDLLDAGYYLWGPGEEFVPEIEENKAAELMGWGNRYYKFIRKNTEKTISINCHVATYKEFYGAPLEKRKYDVTIPGNLDAVMYPVREKIVEKLKGSKYQIFDDYENRTLAYREDDKKAVNTSYKRDEDRILDLRLKLPCHYLDAGPKREAVAFWRENYNEGLRISKMGYADGGISFQIVRKFIEIPARGTLLLCQDIPPLSCLGFKAWENMVTVTPDSVLEVSDYLYAHKDKMQGIATAGRKMVYEKHSPSAYAKHIIDAINVIESGRYKGSYWFDGEFYINQA